ncbi:hypothetical protein GTP44_01025 [Duganella sp. FT50W]|uniref:DUF2190 family protein n=1 Tax=Duganella lactea TaxID=2692173 RepID=A0A6L8MFL1_9BURK|nr:hypothetical protein [Duganella lactea]MYM80542.1 hypothetical protein [Duganella lactea]
MSLTADRNTPHKERENLPVLVAGGAKIFAGAIAMANAAGFCVPGATATNLTYLGRAEMSVDNTAGTDGAATITVRRKKAFLWANSATDPVTQADLFKTCYVVDDQTVAKTNGTNTRSAAGRVVGVDASGVWVE